jgi:hypothetical protein
LLVTLWLLATCEGLGSAHELARRCRRDLPYQWLCGGVPVNYHTLADFYSDHQAELHALFVAHIAALLEQGVVQLQRLTIDGSKIPADAHNGSLHREPTLQRHLRQAEEHVRALDHERTQAGPRTARRQAAQRRAARERHERLQAAVANVRQIQEQRRRGKDGADPAQARASETDPEARRMKMPDGGFRPAYNVQAATDAGSGLIVAVDVTNRVCDAGLLRPLVERVEREHGRRPEEVLADSGFVDQDDIEALEGQHVRLYMPPPRERQEKARGQDPYQRKRGDSDAVAGWRARLGTGAGQQVYARRREVAEWVFAGWANRGWHKFRVRGLKKAQAQGCWEALAHNALRARAQKVRAA